MNDDDLPPLPEGVMHTNQWGRVYTDDDMRFYARAAIVAMKPAQALWAIVEAAIVWAYCPMQGGYRDGPAIEDCCEALTAAVVAHMKVQPGDEWINEAERDAALAGAKHD